MIFYSQNINLPIIFIQLQLQQHPLILSVKTENRPGAAQNNPYLAFRRRTEKMQTRKNRKNDEVSYEKMLKLRLVFFEFIIHFIFVSNPIYINFYCCILGEISVEL